MAALVDNLCNVEQKSIPQSLPVTTSTTTSLDDVIHQCGGFGRFQLRQYCFLSLIQITAGLAAFYYVYGAAEPDHRCRLAPSLWPNDDTYTPINRTHAFFLQLYIPAKEGKWDQCNLFDSLNMNKSLIECPNGLVFDRTIYGFTFTEAIGLVCRNKFERYKRSYYFQISHSNTDISYRFGILLINQFTAGLTHLTSTIAFVTMIELTSSKHRSFIGNLAFLSFVFGEILITLFAYIVRNWQNLLWANTIFIGIALLSTFFTDESPLYLYSKNQYTRLEKTLRRMAKINGRQDIDWYPAFQELLNTQLFPIVIKKQLTFTQKAKQLISHPTTIKRILITGFIAFTETLLYYKISYGLATMKISPYIGILIGAIVEALGYITATVFMSTRFGRKYSFILFTGSTSVCILIIPLIIKHSTLATVIMSQMGKFVVSAANSITWIYIAELFPTSIRSSTNGLAVAVSRLGAITSPIIDASIHKQYLPVTFYVCAALALISALLSLTLPETKDKPLDDIMEFTNDTHV
ncbi:unnamed protein product [Rotaria sp. Silwood2]|nr:unnamed protein product [Rotaria sp. Silwood2]CAF3170742.1 unnamed protein product [Rotaria sp. Silwood2]CAF3964436.1 unnamed protein product [Rotaria sp. Silwood2]CAF4036408.1 unnamed protein product [Rotaria sp. Silwood2]CAF4059416.1 unnamed protein product [Rotaria sp. Silwood2]